MTIIKGFFIFKFFSSLWELHSCGSDCQVWHQTLRLRIPKGLPLLGDFQLLLERDEREGSIETNKNEIWSSRAGIFLHAFLLSDNCILWIDFPEMPRFHRQSSGPAKCLYCISGSLSWNCSWICPFHYRMLFQNNKF